MKQDDPPASPSSPSPLAHRDLPQPPEAAARVRRAAKAAFRDAHAPRTTILSPALRRGGLNAGVVAFALVYLTWAFSAAIALHQ